MILGWRIDRIFFVYGKGVQRDLHGGKRINFFFNKERNGRYGNRMLFDIVLLLLSMHVYLFLLRREEKSATFVDLEKNMICRKQVSLKVLKRLHRNFILCIIEKIVSNSKLFYGIFYLKRVMLRKSCL